ncbi:MAG: adenine phosphoribosyltransferase [Pseudomonadota bacterium]
MKAISDRIRDIPDFPQPGIIFKDLTPVLADAALMNLVSESLVEPFRESGITAVGGMEARGFIFGALAAAKLNVGFIPLRKPGKLPAATHCVTYDLEYGSAELHVHQDALSENDKVLLVDDLIATGGTAAASCELVEKCGAQIVGTSFVVELKFLNGRGVLGNYPIHSLVQY